ncbi:MAG: hypothetical protein ACRD0G_20590 [Acidimicrobiales bacterium]
MGGDGSVARWWIIGVGETDVCAPALVTWQCRCGEAITVNERHRWPDTRDSYLLSPG